MKAKLTDTLIQKRKTPDTGREEIFDTQVQGFGVRIGQRDRAFFFIRRVNGEKTRFSLGQYPAVTLTKARSQALDILNQIKKGEDPREDTRLRKQAASDEAENTFGKIAERFLTEYASGKKKPLRPQTVKGYKWALTGEPSASWKKKTLASITDRDIIKVVDVYEARKQFASARLFRAYAHRFFRWAVEKRLIDKNPASSIPLASAPSDFNRKRVLTLTELVQVLDAADKLENPARAFLKLLLFCGQRRGETSLVKWSDLQLHGDMPTWSIPAENAKNHLPHDVLLPDEAVKVLLNLPKLGEFVFTSDGTTPISGFSKIKAKIDRLFAGHNMPHWTLHDLRRSCATGMADMGIGPHIIEAILNHVSGAKSGVAGLYNRSKYDDERRRALAAWALYLTAGKSSSNVVRIGMATRL
jgi:integrase